LLHECKATSIAITSDCSEINFTCIVLLVNKLCSFFYTW
jgi:hypothetical protein